MTNEL